MSALLITGGAGCLGSNLIVITPGTAQQGGVSQGAGTFNRLSIEDVDALDRQGTLFAAVSPVVMTRAQVIGPAGNWRTSIQGVDADFQQIRDWTTEDGDFFTAEDVFARRKVAIIGATVAKNLFPGQSPVGQRIQVRDTLLDVMGVLTAKGQSVRCPVNTIREVNRGGKGVRLISLAEGDKLLSIARIVETDVQQSTGSTPPMEVPPPATT